MASPPPALSRTCAPRLGPPAPRGLAQRPRRPPPRCPRAPARGVCGEKPARAAAAAGDAAPAPKGDEGFFSDAKFGARGDWYMPEEVRDRAVKTPPPVERVTWYWRLAALLTYLVPAMDSMDFCYKLISEYRSLDIFISAIFPASMLYQSNGFTPLIIFFAMFIGIVRNFKIPHFVRFHTMQSILLDIVSMLGVIIKQYTPFEVKITPIYTALMNVFCVLVFGTILYCAIACVLGKYADIPVISDGVYMQLLNFGSVG